MNIKLVLLLNFNFNSLKISYENIKNNLIEKSRKSYEMMINNKKYIIIPVSIYLSYKLIQYNINKFYFEKNVFSKKIKKYDYFINHILMPIIKKNLNASEYDEFIINGHLINMGDYKESISICMDLKSINKNLFEKIKNIFNMKTIQTKLIDIDIDDEKQKIRYKLFENTLPDVPDHMYNKLYKIQIQQQGLIPEINFCGKCPITAFQGGLYMALFKIKELNNDKEIKKFHESLDYLYDFLKNFYNFLQKNNNLNTLKEQLLSNNIVNWISAVDEIKINIFKKNNQNETINENDIISLITNIIIEMGKISHKINGNYIFTPFSQHISILPLMGILLNQFEKNIRGKNMGIFNFTNINYGIPLIQPEYSVHISPFVSNTLSNLNLVKPGHVESVYYSIDKTEIHNLENFLQKIFDELNQNIIDNNFKWKISIEQFNI